MTILKGSWERETVFVRFVRVDFNTVMQAKQIYYLIESGDLILQHIAILSMFVQLTKVANWKRRLASKANMKVRILWVIQLRSWHRFQKKPTWFKIKTLESDREGRASEIDLQWQIANLLLSSLPDHFELDASVPTSYLSSRQARGRQPSHHRHWAGKI